MRLRRAVWTLLALCLLALRAGSPVRADFGTGTRVPLGTATGQLFQWSTTANGGIGGFVMITPGAANQVLCGSASGTALFRALTYSDISAALINAAGFASITGYSGASFAGGEFGLATGFNGGKFFTGGTAPSLVDLGFDPGNTGSSGSGFRTLRLENRSNISYSGVAPEWEIGGTYNFSTANPPTLCITDATILAARPFVGKSAASVPVTVTLKSGQTGDAIDINSSTGTAGNLWHVDASGNQSAASYAAGTSPGLSVTVPLAKLTTGGSNGSETFTGGILTAYTAPS